MVTNYYELQKGKLESLNPYVYIIVEKKNPNPFFGKWNEYDEKNHEIEMVIC